MARYPPERSTGAPGGSSGLLYTQGVVPVLADWTINAVGTPTVADTDGGITFRGGVGAGVRLMSRSLNGDSQAFFGLMQGGQLSFDDSGPIIGLANSATGLGWGVWFHPSEAREVTIDLGAGTATNGGDAANWWRAGGQYIMRTRIAGGVAYVDQGDGYGYGQCGTQALAAADLAVLGWKTNGTGAGFALLDRVFAYWTEA